MLLILVEVPVKVACRRYPTVNLLVDTCMDVSSMPSVCGCRGPTNHIHRYFHQDKWHGDSSVPSVCDCCGLTSHFHKYLHLFHSINERTYWGVGGCILGVVVGVGGGGG